MGSSQSPTPSLKNFRHYAQSFSGDFISARDRIYHLLGRTRIHESGIHRESLVKHFLRRFLPDALSVDSGFICDGREGTASKQLDVIVWDSHRHSPLYKSGDFVVVPPESVAAVVSVKTTLGKDELEEGLDNLLSVSRIELDVCDGITITDAGGSGRLIPPIVKILLGYGGPSKSETAIRTIRTHMSTVIEHDADLRKVYGRWITDPPHAQMSPAGEYRLERLLPLMIATIEQPAWSCRTGYGPPDGVSYPRLPYLYPQNVELTQPLEKFMYEILRAAYRHLETLGWSPLAAWADVEPNTGVRPGDIYEMDTTKGMRWLESELLAGDGAA